MTRKPRPQPQHAETLAFVTASLALATDLAKATARNKKLTVDVEVRWTGSCEVLAASVTETAP